MLGRYTISIILALCTTGLVIGFQSCGNPNHSLQPGADLVHKIDLSQSGVVTLFDQNHTEQSPTSDLLKSLPQNQPLMVIIRNGHLYPNVQVSINSRTFLVSEYLNLVNLFTGNDPSVPIFSVGLDRQFESLFELKIDLNRRLDATLYCESLSQGMEPQQSDLLVQIADATNLIERNQMPPDIYWSLPLKIFSEATCQNL